MQIKAIVHSAEVRHQQGNAKATGKPYSLFFQTAWLHTFDKSGNPNPYPEKIEVILDKDQVGNAITYPPGEYVLHPSSVYVGRFGNVEISPRLAPVKHAKPLAA